MLLGVFAVGLRLRSFGALRAPQDDNFFSCGLTVDERIAKTPAGCRRYRVVVDTDVNLHLADMGRSGGAPVDAQ